jgi:internalin A
LPPGLTTLTRLDLGGNPLTILVLSEQLAATGLANEVALLTSQGVSVSLYPSPPAESALIPDPGLNTAIRETLGKTAGPLTAEDLLGLTSLDASNRGVSSLEGLGAAHNLTTLNLNDNQPIDFSLPMGLTNLTTLILYNNQLTSLTLPTDLTSLTTLVLYNNQLTSLTLPAGLTSLTTLVLYNNQLTSLTLPLGLTTLTTLDLGRNPLMTLVLSEQLAATGLADEVALLTSQGVSVSLYPPPPTESALIPDPGLNTAIRETLGKTAGPLTAEDLLGLTSLDASNRGVSSLEGLGAAHNLTMLNLNDNQLIDFSLPMGLTNLTTLNLHNNQLTNLTLPTGLTSLTTLILYNNQLTSLTLPAGLTSLTTLDLRYTQLSSLTLPAGLTSLTMLDLGFNQLTNLTLPAGLTSLTTLDIGDNQLTDFSFLSGLTNLTTLDLNGNQLTSLTLLAGLTSLTSLSLDGNPLLKTFVLSEQLAATGLADKVASLKGQGVSVYTYPAAVSLRSGQHTTAGAFEFTLTGPPGAYTILGSVDLAVWSEVGTLTNELGTAVFPDVTVKNSLQNFYRARAAAEK